MREKARDKGRLEDIIEYSSNVIMLIEGCSFDSFLNDIRTYYSVMKNIEIVGEAAYMITKAFKESHPELPWKFVQGMRHVLVHDYATIDDKELYNTAVNDIPEIKKQVERYLAETDWDEWKSMSDDCGDISNDVLKTDIEYARKMKANGCSTQIIIEVTGLSAKEIEEL